MRHDVGKKMGTVFNRKDNARTVCGQKAHPGMSALERSWRSKPIPRDVDNAGDKIVPCGKLHEG